jgi:hypothetical protein
VTPTVFEHRRRRAPGRTQLTKPTRSTSRIVHHTLDVKGWLAAPPSVEAARPGACVDCGAASRPPGGKLGLHGHGHRDRQLRGPREVGSGPGWIVIACRRYRCVRCGAVLTVVPRGVAPRRHYGHAAIAMALTLWAIVGAPVASVRRQVCAWPITTEAGTRWPTLQRWARAARRTVGDLRLSLIAAAARVAQIAIGRAPPSLRTTSRVVQAFAGGSAMP